MKTGIVLLLVCIGVAHSRMFMVAKPKVQDLINWQLDEDFKNMLEMDRPPVAKYIILSIFEKAYF